MMAITNLANERLNLVRVTQLIATIVFETAWRIGTGREGETMSDLGVMLGPDGVPVLPGSSLKGRLRSTCESLASHFGLHACFLDREASGVTCVSDVDYYSQVRSQYQDQLKAGMAARLRWIDQHTCDVCKLFGSPLQASRLRITEGRLTDGVTTVQVRDGVVLDRDSHTARNKYDYDVIPPGSQFDVTIDLTNPAPNDLALLGAALFDWHAGFSIGGFTSRGLGRAQLVNVKVSAADLTDPNQRKQFLCSLGPAGRLTDQGDWTSYFQKAIDQVLTSSFPT
jgi:CRISPR-associated RAMP protein (TIGR02581 family)